VRVRRVFAPWIAPHNPFDLASLELSDARTASGLEDEGGSAKYLLGTDDQGRDVLSAIMYGARISLLVGFASVLVSVLVGVSLGLLSGFVGGKTDAFIMRVCDVMLSFPVDPDRAADRRRGPRDVPRRARHAGLRGADLAIALPAGCSTRAPCAAPRWSSATRSTCRPRASSGVAPLRIMSRHVLPNVLGPVLVLATIQVATAILTEATLSFLGVGVPPTQPSLGTLIRVGNDFLFSGEWWITIFPGLMLVLIALSVNLLGDWLRDALNPRLR
jgi:peptide/nickel transport system permease protein